MHLCEFLLPLQNILVLRNNAVLETNWFEMSTDEHTNEEDVEFEPTKDEPFEETEIVEEEAGTALKLKKMRDRLAASDKEKRKYLEELQRSKADFLNAKKRLEEEKQAAKEVLTNRHIEALLPLCDSFQMAMSDQKAWEAVDSTWRSGVEGIQAQLKTILDSYGVVAIHPEGEEFNPQKHEAMTNVPVDSEADANKIVSVIQSGYERKTDKGVSLIRPARVTVGVFEK